MPAPKGIPIPEAKASRLDERIDDSRWTKGWMSEDERLVATHSGKVLVEVALNDIEWDEETGDLLLRLGGGEADRALRWLRHALEHTGHSRRDLGLLERTLGLTDAITDWD